MPVLHESTTPAELAACAASSPCAACRKRNGEAVNAGSVHSYGTQPRNGWVPRRLADGSEPTAPTFGVELETQVVGRATVYPYRRDPALLSGEELVAAATPRGHWHAQHDGSVSGPEFASQPASLAVWRDIAGQVGSFMRTAIHGGLRSHDGPDSCSMHVNIGVDAFADADHLARFIRLATVNPRWTTRLAQRTHEQVAAWARFDRYPDMASCESLARAFTSHGYAGTGHGAAVNLENRGRVEFRVPRGTLRLDRFMAKLEWVAAMVEYTRDAANRPVPGAFTEWAIARRIEYPQFYAMVADLMPARLAPRTASRARPVAPVSPAQGAPATRTVASCGATNHMGWPCTYLDGHGGFHDYSGRPTYRLGSESMRADDGVLHSVHSARFAGRPVGVTGATRCVRCHTTWASHEGLFCVTRVQTGGDGIESVFSMDPARA